jgi:hypothetical protein
MGRRNSEIFVRAVAKWGFGGVLALAEPGVARLFGREFHRGKGRPLVRTIAEGLVGGISASAEKVVLSCFEADFDRTFGGDGRDGHDNAELIVNRGEKPPQFSEAV